MGNTLQRSDPAKEPTSSAPPHRVDNAARLEAGSPWRPFERLGTTPPPLLPTQQRAWAASMQRAYGNKAVAQLLTKGRPVLRRACSACVAAEKDEDEEQVIRREPAPGAPGMAPPAEGLAGYLRSSAHAGQPLDAGTRGSFETGFGVPLDRVRVIADEGAARAADALGARAFTLGSSIWFGRGEYRPHSDEGRRLLAHEVAHTVQQGMTGPSIQRDVVIGSASDPAEAAADLAADAVMVGERVSMSSAAPVLRRTCTPQPGRTADERRMTCSQDSYYLTRHQGTTPGAVGPRTQFSTQFNYDNQSISVDIRVCRGGTELIITPSASINIPVDQAAAQVLANAVTGAALLAGLTIAPGLRLRVRQSQSFEVTISGAPTIDSTGTVTQVNATLSVRIQDVGEASIGAQYTPPSGGLPGFGGLTFSVPFDLGGSTRRRRPQIPTIDCSGQGPPQPTYSYSCERIVPGTPAQPAVTQNPITHVYALFEYMTDRVVGWMMEGSETVQPDDAPTMRALLEGLASNGFRATAILGMTSPEGPVRGARGFEGNQRLSERRAAAAHTKLQTYCPSCADPLLVVGTGETYPQFQTDEGQRLAAETKAAFLGGTPVPDPLRPSDPAAFEQANRANLTQAVYGRLRRAVITLTRNAVVTEAVPAVPEHPEPVSTCPPEVLAAAPSAFGAG